jgi:general stress protein 26
MSLKGAKITPGTLYKITNKRTGQVKELIRAVQVRHIVNTTGWETFIELEQDNKTITEMK